MLLDYYDFPKIPLNRIFCSEPMANPVKALDTFSDCAFTPSPCLRPSCRGPSSPKEFKPQHHTAIVINQDHNLYPPHDQFFQFTYSRHTAKFTGEIRQQHWWLLIGWGFNSSTATFPHVYLLESPTDSFFCRWAEAVAGRHGFRHRESLQSKCLKATPHSWFRVAKRRYIRPRRALSRF